MSEISELYRSEETDNNPSLSAHAENDGRQTGNDEHISADKISQENIEEIADKVYRLMKRDLMLERERSTRIGG